MLYPARDYMLTAPPAPPSAPPSAPHLYPTSPGLPLANLHHQHLPHLSSQWREGLSAFREAKLQKGPSDLAWLAPMMLDAVISPVRPPRDESFADLKPTGRMCTPPRRQPRPAPPVPSMAPSGLGPCAARLPAKPRAHMAAERASPVLRHVASIFALLGQIDLTSSKAKSRVFLARRTGRPPLNSCAGCRRIFNGGASPKAGDRRRCRRSRRCW